MAVTFQGGIDIAMKVPPYQVDAMITFYRDVVRLKPITDKAPAVGFELGPNKLWIDEAPGMSQAEVWLELFADQFAAAAKHLAAAGIVRCDAIEPLPEGRMDHHAGKHRAHGSRTGRMVISRYEVAPISAADLALVASDVE